MMPISLSRWPASAEPLAFAIARVYDADDFVNARRRCRAADDYMPPGVRAPMRAARSMRAGQTRAFAPSSAAGPHFTLLKREL